MSLPDILNVCPKLKTSVFFLRSIETASLDFFSPYCRGTSDPLSAGEIYWPCFYLIYILVVHPLSPSLQLVTELVVHTYCWVMQCNTLLRKRGKKEVFLRPSSLTGGLGVPFMCWIHPYRPPGSINCLLQWSSVPQCGTSAHLVDSSSLRKTMPLILLSCFYATADALLYITVIKTEHLLIFSCLKF